MGMKCARRSGSRMDWRTGRRKSFGSPRIPALLLSKRQPGTVTGSPADSERRLIYVVRDFDTVAEYWESVRDGLTDNE